MYFWLFKDDIRAVIQRPKVKRYMESLQYFDKVNCNCAGLGVNKGKPCTWAEPNSSRPSIYKWIEETFDVESSNINSGDCKGICCEQKK